ncbi:MAG: hypothetical protein ACI9OJ_005382, partial [Myxococcota bacterium]
AGCSSDEEVDETPACVQTLCESGAKVCLGNVAATCNSDGLGYATNSCGATLSCEEGSCAARKCPFLGQTKCKDGITLNTCAEDGATLTESVCGTDEVCRAGACLPVECEAGLVQCGFREFSKCNDSGNGWQPVTACEGDEVCFNGACAAQACVPETRRCKDETTMQTCTNDATTWEDAECATGEACDSTTGGCLPKLCEVVVETPDTSGGDSGGTDGTDGTDGDDVVEPKEITNPLQPKDEAAVTINGTDIEFSITVSATFVSATNDLRISMNKGQSKVEISITPLEEFDIGVYKSTEQSETNVTIFYHDGTPLVGMAQFRYTSVDYEVELIKFEAKEGRVKGRFSGTFTDDGGATTIPFTGGEFDVRRHN